MKSFKKIIYLFLIFILIFVTVSCNKDEEEYGQSYYYIGMDTNYEQCSGLEDGNGEIAHVLILAGQSNCTGCSITKYLKEQSDPEDYSRYENGYENILINFNIDNHRTSSKGKFVKTDLLCGSYDEEFGPEVGLSDTLNKEFPNEKFYILKFSMSGFSLNHHWLYNGNRSEIYNAQLIFIKNALDYMKDMNYNVSLDAFLWMQGESDVAENNAKKYYENESKYISYLREDLKEYIGSYGMYFISAGISDSPWCEPGYETINKAKEKVSKLSDLNIYFSTIDNGLTTLNEPYYEPDLGHYDALSEIKLGELFGEAVCSIYKK